MYRMATLRVSPTHRSPRQIGKKREVWERQEAVEVKFRKMLGLPGPTRFGDPFGLLPLCESLGLGDKAQAILKSCQAAAAVDVAEERPDLPHTASYLGGQPAVPERFSWPASQAGTPMRFVGQFACSELSLAKLSGFPEEGLISIFLDALDDEAKEAQVYHFSLKRELRRQSSPSGLAETSTYRANFSTIPSLPRPGSLEYEAMAFSEDEADAYYQLLVELEESLEPCHIRCSGHAPFSDEDGCYPEVGEPAEWDFFLAVRDVEELEIAWPETGCAMLWLPKGAERFSGRRTGLTWQTIDADWDDEDESDDEEEDESDEDSEE